LLHNFLDDRPIYVPTGPAREERERERERERELLAHGYDRLTKA
jgi:hypothetical protein